MSRRGRDDGKRFPNTSRMVKPNGAGRGAVLRGGAHGGVGRGSLAIRTARPGHAGESAAAAGQKRRRKDPYTACNICKRRKVRCDGASPCMHCRNRGDLCEYTQQRVVRPNKRRRDNAGTVVRVPRASLHRGGKMERDDDEEDDEEEEEGDEVDDPRYHRGFPSETELDDLPRGHPHHHSMVHSAQADMDAALMDALASDESEELLVGDMNERERMVREATLVAHSVESEELSAGVQRHPPAPGTALVALDSIPAVRYQDAQIARNYTRAHYLDIFMRFVNPGLRLLDPETDLFAPTNQGELLQQNAAICFASRSLGHRMVTFNLLAECRAMAGDLIDNFTPSCAAGYLLLALFHFGEENEKGAHYAAIALSLSRLAGDSYKPKHVIEMVRMSHILEGPDRPYYGVQSIDRLVLPRARPLLATSSALSVAMIGTQPGAEELLDIARRFPVHSRVMEEYCHMRLVNRLPIDQRTDEFMDLSKSMFLIEFINRGEKAYRARNPQTDAEQSGLSPEEVGHQRLRHAALMAGLRVHICNAAGLLALACQNARDSMRALQSLPAHVMGFNFTMVVVPVMHMANLAYLYKINPFGEHLDYRNFLHELIAVVHPLAANFISAHSLVTLLHELAAEDVSIPPYMYRPRPDELAVAAPLLVGRTVTRTPAGAAAHGWVQDDWGMAVDWQVYATGGPNEAGASAPAAAQPIDESAFNQLGSDSKPAATTATAATSIDRPPSAGEVPRAADGSPPYPGALPQPQLQTAAAAAPSHADL